MKKTSFILAVFMVFGLALTLAACSGDAYDQDHHPLSTAQDTQSKDRTSLLTCEDHGFVIYDCFDACQCCLPLADENVGDHAPLEQCIFYCDGLLLAINDIENKKKVDIDNYKECVIGCFSICAKPDKETACKDECKVYLGQ